MRFVDKVLRRLASLLLISLLADCVPLSPRTFGSSGKRHEGPGQNPSWAPPTLPPRPPAATIAVRCLESSIEIALEADLFGTGVVIDGRDLRLGWNPLVKGAKPGAKCGAVASGEGVYTIVAELTDCGTELVFTNEWLVYKNSILYSPAPAPDGVIRLEEIVIPFKCHYKRQYSVDSIALAPTWVPFSAKQSAEEAFSFSLRLLTADWRSERASHVYFLGDVIHLEASVFQGKHVPLRVFVEACMATLVPDVNSDPRYAFIENGCLTDARATGSRSRFLPRTRDDRLHVELDAFRIYRDSRDLIYITCLVSAEPLALSTGSTSQACSYADGRWTSADGNDRACGSCEGPHGFSSGKKTTEVGVWKRGTKADDAHADAHAYAVTRPPAGASASRQNVTVGPLVVRDLEQADTPEVLVAENSGTSVDTPGSAVDPSAVTTVVDTAKALPVEQGDESEDPAVLVTGQVEHSGASTLPLAGQSANSMDGPFAISLEADTMGSSGLGPEQDQNLDELETVPAEPTPGPVDLDTLAAGENEEDVSVEGELS